MKTKSIIGQKFGMLTVIARSENSKNGKARWICMCDCGNEKKNPVTAYDLVKGKVRSCGCIKKTCYIEQNKTHGETKTRLWSIWQGMRQRCKKNKCYVQRGITVCKEWESFEKFRDWAKSNGYADNLTIDRIDNDSGYYPDNCRWATYKEQENNRRNNVKITINGITHTASEWSDITGIYAATIAWRAKHNWNEDDMLIKPDLANKHIRRKKHECGDYERSIDL